MSIIGKHWYRFNFLKSQEWQDFRIEMLADAKGKCYCCKTRSVHNDVHHVWYGEPSYTGMRQFVVLCRVCHDFVHDKVLATGAKTESEKRLAYKAFMAAIDSVKLPLKHHLSEAKSVNCCYGCASLENIVTIDLIKIEPSVPGFPVCPECLAGFKAKFKPLEKGKAPEWKRRKEHFNAGWDARMESIKKNILTSK